MKTLFIFAHSANLDPAFVAGMIIGGFITIFILIYFKIISADTGGILDFNKKIIQDPKDSTLYLCGDNKVRVVKDVSLKDKLIVSTNSNLFKFPTLRTNNECFNVYYSSPGVPGNNTHIVDKHYVLFKNVLEENDPLLEIFRIEGITEILLNTVCTLYVYKSPALTWDELTPKILEFLFQYIKK